MKATRQKDGWRWAEIRRRIMDGLMIRGVRGWLLLLAVILIGVLLLIRQGEWGWNSRYKVSSGLQIRKLMMRYEREERLIHQPFQLTWDSLMANRVVRESWDSLLRLRPGLADTVTQIRRMDSAIWMQ